MRQATSNKRVVAYASVLCHVLDYWLKKKHTCSHHRLTHKQRRQAIASVIGRLAWEAMEGVSIQPSPVHATVHSPECALSQQAIAEDVDCAWIQVQIHRLTATQPVAQLRLLLQWLL